MYSHRAEYQIIPLPSLKLVDHEVKHDMTCRCTSLSGTFAMDSKGADTHCAVLSWQHQNSNKESSTAILYPFTFNCEIHVYLCDSMNCSCIYINYLFEHYRKTKFESTFQYLPSHVQTEMNDNKQFCQSLYHQVFNTANGRRIINNQTTRNIVRQELLVRYPTTQQALATPIVDELIQPRKTSKINRKRARYMGNGKVSGGNTISPNRDHRRRESERFANAFTYDVCPQNMMSHSVMDVLALVPEEPPSRHNLDLSAEAYDQQQLIEEPIIENGLTQDMHDMIDNNDDVDNGESVPVEDGTLTPTLREDIDRFTAENEEQRVLTTQEHLTLATQKEAASMTEDEELSLMNTHQFLTPATQEEAAADVSAAGSTQNHSDSEEDVTAATGFDATAKADAAHNGQRHEIQQIKDVIDGSYITNQAETEYRSVLVEYGHCPPLLVDIDANTDGYKDRHPHA